MALRARRYGTGRRQPIARNAMKINVTPVHRRPPFSSPFLIIFHGAAPAVDRRNLPIDFCPSSDALRPARRSRTNRNLCPQHQARSSRVAIGENSGQAGRSVRKSSMRWLYANKDRFYLPARPTAPLTLNGELMYVVGHPLRCGRLTRRAAGSAEGCRIRPQPTFPAPESPKTLAAAAEYEMFPPSTPNKPSRRLLDFPQPGCLRASTSPGRRAGAGPRICQPHLDESLCAGQSRSCLD